MSNNIISVQDFPTNKSYTEFVQITKDKYEKLNNNLQRMILNSDKVCFVCCNTMNIKSDFLMFLLELQRIYKNKSFILLNIRYNATKCITKYQFGENITIFDVTAEYNSEDDNNKLWNDVCANLSLAN